MLVERSLSLRLSLIFCCPLGVMAFTQVIEEEDLTPLFLDTCIQGILLLLDSTCLVFSNL